MSKHEYIMIDGRRYRKFIHFPEEVTDGTLRCIACGQIEDEPWHDEEICKAERAKAWEASFSARTTDGGDRHGE
nr:hypothetical protein [Brucella anthropi]